MDGAGALKLAYRVLDLAPVEVVQVAPEQFTEPRHLSSIFRRFREVQDAADAEKVVELDDLSWDVDTTGDLAGEFVIVGEEDGES